MQLDRKTRWQLDIQKWVFTVLLLCSIGMLGWLSQHYSWQADLTTNKRNSLSQGSIELLQQIPGDVSINIYSREDPTLHAAVDEIMNRYRRIKHNIDYRMVNPDVDIETAEIDGVKQYGEIIVKYAGNRESITSLSEQAISSALLRLSREGTRRITFLAGHGERDPRQADNRGYSKIATKLQNKGFSVGSHNLLEEPLPGETTVLVIAGPGKALLPGELEQVETFINEGGNVLWLADTGPLNGLEPLAAALALKFHDGMVVDNNVDLRNTLRIEHPAIIPVLEYYPHAITGGIDYNTLFPLARGVEPDIVNDDSGWQHTILWRSFERSWTETSKFSDEIVFSTEDGDIAGPITLAVALERIVIGNDKASQRIVVTGDTDFMANAYIGVGANLDLALNVFEWLGGDDDLIAVDIKDARDLQLKLSDTQVIVIGAGFLVALPLALLITGGTIWYRRRNR